MVFQRVVEMPSLDPLFPSTHHRPLAEALHQTFPHQGVSQNVQLEAGTYSSSPEQHGRPKEALTILSKRTRTQNALFQSSPSMVGLSP